MNQRVGESIRTPPNSEASNHAGEFWVGGYEKAGDKGTGRLTSASFEVTQPWASFLVGGGRDVQTRVEIVEETGGKVIKNAGGTMVENMRREVVDLRSFAGKRIFALISTRWSEKIAGNRTSARSVCGRMKSRNSSARAVVRSAILGELVSDTIFRK